MKATWIAVWFCASAALVLPAQAAVLDLNEFFFDPTVEVFSDGAMAVLNEDPIFALVVLSLDPGLGDPNLIIPGPGLELLFDYDVNIPPTDGDTVNNDEFAVFLLDASTGLSLGGAFEFATTSSATGELSFDLSTLTGRTLGLQFQLVAMPGDIGLNSTASIANVRLQETPDPDPDPDPDTPAIPEPSSVFLLLGGLALAGWISRPSH